MRASLDATERRLIVAGSAAALAVLLLALLSPGAVLTGWMAAAAAFGAVPSGALLLVLMMRLIPGAWGEALRLPGEVATLLVPAAAVAMLPVMLGMAAIYPWVGHGPANPFQAAWLAPVPFVARTLIHFAAQMWLAVRMRRRRATVATAAVGLVVLPLTTTLVAVDWLMSLDPEFASSAFGLRFLTLAATMAFCAMLLLRLAVKAPPARLGVLGGLLLTLLLLSAYFLFLPFFVVWSSNVAANVDWYAERWTPGWLAAAWAFGLLGGVPIVPLLFARVRGSARWLAILSSAVLASSAIELAWLALPGRGTLAIGVYALTLFGFAALTVALLRLGLRSRIRARLPAEAR